MLHNYIKLNNKIIKQENVIPFSYNYDYSNKYNNFKSLSLQMSYLRLGYLIGNLQFIPNSILDIGYGNGDFLNVAYKIISNCYGYDISDYPLPTNVKRIYSLCEQTFDVVTMFDTLEHFPDIYIIKQIKTNYFLISVPECHYFSDEWFANWKHRKPNEHIYHFNKFSLENFMNELNFQLIHFSNVEDIIRTPTDQHSNILTGFFKRRD